MGPKIDLLKLRTYGTVAEIRQDVVHVAGLSNCMNGQLLRIGDSAAQGVVLGFDPSYVLVLLLTPGAVVKPGDRVVTTLDEFQMPVGSGFVGRRVNAMMSPIDGQGTIRQDAAYPIFGRAPGVLEREPLSDVLHTGTKIIDMTLPIGKGQRMLVIGDRMTGKTTVAIDAIVNQKGKNVLCIYCAIGKAEAAVNRIVEVFDQKGVWEYGMIVAATAADPIGQQYLAPYVAASLGEYFMHEHRADVLVIFDDFTKHAWAYRQISLMLNRAPGRDAYPGDIFYIHSQLVERACKLKPEQGGGTMTHIPIVETLQGDVAGYIPSNIISMTDGQVYFNSALFGEGFKPAIDMGLSVSRIGSRVQWPAMKKPTAMLKLDFVRYKELEKLTRIKAGISAGVEERLRKGRILEEVLKQDANAPVAMEDQVMTLVARNQGFFDDLDPDEVKGRLHRLLKHLHGNRADLVSALVEGKTLTDEIREGLHEELAKCKDSAL